MPARAAPETHLRTLDVSKLTPRTRPEHLRTLPVSPHVQTCEAEASRTVQKLGILSSPESLARYQKTKLASLSGMWFPSAQLEVVQVCTDINWWVATFDDRIDGDFMQGTAAVIVLNCMRDLAKVVVSKTELTAALQFSQGTLLWKTLHACFSFSKSLRHSAPLLVHNAVSQTQ